MKLNKALFLGLLAVPALLVNSAIAATVTGSSNIAGNVTVSGTAITFAPTFTNTPGATETGDFAGLTGGTIKSLTGGPVTGATNVPGFVMFTQGVASPITFDLTNIAPGVGTPAGCANPALGACTPPGSPFTLIQLGSNTVVVTLQVNGTAYIGSPATGSSPTVGVFSTQTATEGTIPQIIATLNAGGSISGITYSASFAASPTAPNVPEPASMALFGVGLVGAGLLARRKALKH